MTCLNRKGASESQIDGNLTHPKLNLYYMEARYWSVDSHSQNLVAGSIAAIYIYPGSDI